MPPTWPRGGSGTAWSPHWSWERARLVVLAAATDSPPPRRVGLYSDGAQHMTVVAPTPDGRRLFIDADGGVLTSNVPELVLARR